MARLFTAGAEIGADNGLVTDYADGHYNGTTPMTRDTSVVRSGSASYKLTGAAGTGDVAAVGVSFASATSYYLRVYINAASAPSSAFTICSLAHNGAGSPSVRLRTDGTLELKPLNAGTAATPTSGTVTDGAWHRIELGGTVGTGTGQWASSELLVDGSSVATDSTASTVIGNAPGWGAVLTGGNAPSGYVMYFDDVAVNSSTGAAQNTYPGDGKVVLLRPISDNAVGTGWTTSGGASTGLWDNVDNTPPTGIADTTANAGHQIRNASSALSNYDANMTTYTSAGIGASDTVNAVVPWVWTGAPVSTGAKGGIVGLVSNPNAGTSGFGGFGGVTTFWSGAAAGTWPSGWITQGPGTTMLPSVTLGTSPVLRVGINSGTASRIAMVSFMGVYVDYTPAVAAATSLVYRSRARSAAMLTR